MIAPRPASARPPPTGVRQPMRLPFGEVVVVGGGAVAVEGGWMGVGGLRLGVDWPSGGGFGPSLFGRRGSGSTAAVSVARGTVRMKRWRAEMDQSLGVLPTRS